MEFSQLIKKRKMVREYSSRMVLGDVIDRLLQYAAHPPSAGHTLPCRAVVITDSDIKYSLCSSAWNQGWVKNAPVVIAIVSDVLKSGTRYGTRGITRYSFIDGAFYAMLLHLGAVDLGLASCFVGAFSDLQVRDALGLSAQEIPIGLLCVGYAYE